MKRIILAITAVFLGAGIVFAALSEADLEPAVIRARVTALAPEERPAYAKQVLEAIAALPIDDEEKTKKLARAARALIAGADEMAGHIIAEIFNTVPMPYLVAVSNLLKSNFGQEANGLTDDQFDQLAKTIVKRSSEYIQTSGTDSPALRMSVVAATFVGASTNPQRTQEAVVAEMPDTVQPVADTYIQAVVDDNRELISAASGEESVEPTPDDPDADHIVQGDNGDEAPAAETDYLDSATATRQGGSAVGNIARRPGVQGGPVVAQVPLLSRSADDLLGIVTDVQSAATYDWDSANEAQEQGEETTPQSSTMPGESGTQSDSDPITPPGTIEPTQIEPPSDLYRNQSSAPAAP